MPNNPAPPGGEFYLPRHPQWIAPFNGPQGDDWVVYWHDITAQKQVGRQH